MYIWFDASVLSFHPCRRIVFALDTRSISAEALEDFVLFTKHFKALHLRVNKSEVRHYVAAWLYTVKVWGAVQLQVGDVIRDNTGDMLSHGNWRNNAKYKACLLAKVACQTGTMRRTVFFMFFQCMHSRILHL